MSLTVHVVTVEHQRSDVGSKTPIRYDVYGDGPRRCGKMRLLGVTTKEPKYDDFAKDLLHPQFHVVSYR